MDLSGKIVFASGRATNFDIWVLDILTKRLHQLTVGEHWNDFPKWSPDGKQVAFISMREDTISSLWIMNADGSDQRALTKNIHCGFPSWSPDGRQILFTSNSANPNEINLCVINADGSEGVREILSRAGQETEPSWSRDGKTILFAAPESVNERGFSSRNTDIWEYEISSKQVRKLTSHPAKDYCPAYSPDGSKIAFVSHRNPQTDEQYLQQMEIIRSAVKANDIVTADEGIRKIMAMEQDADIWIMDRNGRNLRPLTDNKTMDVGIAWSPCGNYIVYTSASKRNHETEHLRIIDVATGNSTALDYDRTPFENEIGAGQLLNATFLQTLIPDIIERRFVDFSFWGEERHPDWTK